ncbi:MAG: DUF480 domain-containing protein [Planctomycetota bacterium]
MVELDRTEARIVGALIEKARTVPDTYPLSENALLAACNQKSNRDPVMDLQLFEVKGACMALHQREILARIEGGSRVVKFRHKLDEKLGLGDHAIAVLCELLVRGPQAPGALKPRVARLGFHGTPAQIEDVLRELASQAPPLVAQQPKRPRERDHRWAHLLGPGGVAAEDHDGDSAAAAAAAPRPDIAGLPDDANPATGAGRAAAAGSDDTVLERLAALEARVDELERQLDENG